LGCKLREIFFDAQQIPFLEKKIAGCPQSKTQLLENQMSEIIF